MSLTSYRAAPPRVTRFLPKAKYRIDRLVACAGFCRRQNTVGLIRIPERERTACIAALRYRRGRLSVEKICGSLFRDPDYIAFSRPGSDLLSRVLRRSTIGAGAFHGRVRNGNGCSHPAITTRSAKGNVMRSWYRRLPVFLKGTRLFPCLWLQGTTHTGR